MVEAVIERAEASKDKTSAGKRTKKAVPREKERPG